MRRHRSRRRRSRMPQLPIPADIQRGACLAANNDDENDGLPPDLRAGRRDGTVRAVNRLSWAIRALRTDRWREGGSGTTTVSLGDGPLRQCLLVKWDERVREILGTSWPSECRAT